MNSESQSLVPATQQDESEELTVDEVQESLSTTEKGQPANTIGNCRTVFCQDPLLQGAIRLNLLTDRVDIVRDLGWRRSTSALTDTDVKYLLLYFEQNYGLTSEKKLMAALSIVANENCYHPIQDVLNSLVWGRQAPDKLLSASLSGADESNYVEEMLKHFLLGAIRRVFHPGSKYEELLCLVGGQGAGKSTFFRFLAIQDEWFSDDLKKLDDDKVFAKLQGHWIIEMSEMLATSNAKSIEEIRSFISRQKETYRTPYESQPKDRLRQWCVRRFLQHAGLLTLDRAGNRRFLPVMIYPEKAEVHILEDEAVSKGISVAGVGGGYDHLPQRRVFHEIFKGDSKAVGGSPEGLHAGGYRSRANSGLPGTLHRQCGLLQAAVQGSVGTRL